MRGEVYWLPGPWSGRLAIVPRPRGGDWLEDEIGAWKAAGISVVVSALQHEEAVELDIAREGEWCRAFGIEYINFAIPDRGVPTSVRMVAELLRPLEKKLGEGQNVAIHCRQGIGRSALLAASLLVLADVRPEDAFERIGVARGCGVPDTPEQQQWVGKFAKDVLAPARAAGK
jgi:protein-tyrosine phosphatase